MNLYTLSSNKVIGIIMAEDPDRALDLFSLKFRFEDVMLKHDYAADNKHYYIISARHFRSTDEYIICDWGPVHSNYVYCGSWV